MKDTITPKEFYSVKLVRNLITGEELRRIDDGVNPLFVAKERTMDEYLDESFNNECFERMEVFTTRKGNQFIYWRDNEIDADYITKVVTA